MFFLPDRMFEILSGFSFITNKRKALYFYVSS